MGHYVRSLALIRGLREHRVYFVNGGVPIREMPPPADVFTLQLPPIQCDAQFSELQMSDAQNVQQQRVEHLLELQRTVQPNVIVIELFPFGRKKFEFELLPLLESNLATPQPAKVVCSLRDILVKKADPAKFEERVCRLVNRFFDVILVHADPQMQTLAESFSRIDDLRAEIHYTGYVVSQNGISPEEPPPGSKSDDLKITVSAGGGRVGFPLLKTAAQALKKLDSTRPLTMTLVTGPFLPKEQRWQLQLLTVDEPRLRVKTFVPNLCQTLTQADLSISMAGYNTCLDILQAGVRALLVPFNGGGNDEQLRRARALSHLGAASVLHPHKLTAHNLARAIDAVLNSSLHKVKLNLNGVQVTRKIVGQLTQLN